MLLLPETPRFLIKQDKHEQAAAALAKIRRLPADHPAIIQELAEVQANHNFEMSLGTASYLDCFKGTIGKRLATGCALQGLQQLSGVNFIFYYGTQYFENAGFTAGGFTIQVITNVVNVVSTLPGLYLVEKMGRRGLLLMGAIGMCAAQFIVAITGTASAADNIAAQRAAIAFVCIYIVSDVDPCELGSMTDQTVVLLRLFVGSCGLGCHWRAVPAQGSRKVLVNE